MAELPYFPFYPADWISSPRNMCLTLAQQGAYMRLLCFCWTSGDCSLPGDPEQLRALSTLDEHLFSSVRVLFEQHPTKTGYVTNKRLYKEWVKAVDLRVKKSQAGKKSGESRRTGVQQVYEQKGNTPRTISESESESSLHLKKDSEKTEETTLSRSSRDFMQEAREVLQFLNLKSGRQFRAVDTNLKLIAARLKGESKETEVDIQTCKTMITKKARDWAVNPDMEKYIRPETLFGKKHFESYLGEVSTCTAQTVTASSVGNLRPVPAGGGPKPCSPPSTTGSSSNVPSLVAL